MVASERCVWVLLAYRVPREPSTPRIAIWRRMRRLGVARVGEGLVALPADARTQEQMDWIADEIIEAGGSSTLWRAELTSRAQERTLVEALAAERAAEYTALIQRAEAVRSDAGSTSVRAVRSLRHELRQIRRRDYFPPPERERARAAIEELAGAVLVSGQPKQVDA